VYEPDELVELIPAGTRDESGRWVTVEEKEKREHRGWVERPGMGVDGDGCRRDRRRGGGPS